MNYEETNKLIADYMNVLPTYDIWDDNSERGVVRLSRSIMKDEVDKEISHYEDRYNIKPKAIETLLDYHACWDSLKPVVDEIKLRCKGVPKEFIGLTLFSQRKEVYEAVLEFINNQNK